VKESKQILIVSTCPEDWGGSEELWGRAVPFLINLGYQVTVCKEKINPDHPEYKKLAAVGTIFYQLNASALTHKKPLSSIAESALKAYLQKEKVSLVVISQGINFDGLGMGYNCLRENIPYALIAQKAVDINWPYHIDRVGMRNVYLNAAMAYFVSNHNLQLTEEQFGIRFSNATVVSNPVKLARYTRPYPSTENGYRLASIGRFLLIDKGQDILIRIMAREKWKARPLKVSFIGSGIDKAGLIELAQLLNADNVEFLDQQNDVEKLWEEYHALILPSRFEGMPLVLLESMAFGRTAIVSNAGGNAELICDGESGFVGNPNETDFDEAMERAWISRNRWKAMGSVACEKIKSSVPELPERDFADSLDKLANVNSPLVSVIIPTYNRARLVESAIVSVLKQTYPLIQLIVADDGSNDDTAALMAKYPQVTYLKLPHGGQAYARNEGLRHARGNYVASLDSDDTWEPGFVQRCIQILDDNKLDFVFANWMQDMGNGQFVDRFTMCDQLKEILAGNNENTILLDNFQLRKIYMTGCPSPSSSLLIKRSSLRSNWTPGLKIADDWCLLMDMIYTKPCTAGFTRDILWHKKRDGQNICDGKGRYDLIRDLKTHDGEILFNRFKSFYTKEERNMMRIKLSYYYLRYAYYLLRHNKTILPSIKYTFRALWANNRIILEILFRIKNKLRKLMVRVKIYNFEKSEITAGN